MKITKEEDYGILLIQALLYPSGKNYLPLTKIAQKYHLSEFFLKRVAKKLKKAGLIISKEGVNGGYLLAKTPSLITYSDIISAVSGPIDISPSCPECNKKVCHQKIVWQLLNKKITNILNSQLLVTSY